MPAPDNRVALAPMEAVSLSLGDTDPFDLNLSELGSGKSTWSLDPVTLRFLARLVLRMQPRHVLEFGSGVSTRVFEWAVSRCQKPGFISVLENDPKYAAEARERAGGRVKVQQAPLVARRCGGKYLPVFALSRHRLASRRPADLILVDGPPAVLGGREGVLYQALDFARPGTVILLDDADRLGETEALRNWSTALGESVEVRFLSGFPKGLASIIVRDPNPAGRPVVLGYAPKHSELNGNSRSATPESS